MSVRMPYLLVSFLLPDEANAGPFERGDQALRVVLRHERSVSFGMLFEHLGIGALLGQLGGTAFGVKIRSLFAAILAGVGGGLRFDLPKRANRALVGIDVRSNHAPLAFDHAGGCQLLADFRHAEVLARGLLLGEELRGLVGTTGP